MPADRINILLADDDQDDCLLFNDALSELPINCKLTVVHNGDHLIQLLQNTAANRLPDVVFLDLNMPRKNGFECLEEIKEDASLKNLSVIIFSTSLEKEKADLLYQRGARFYIRKPTEFDQLTRVVFQAINFLQQNNFVQPTREEFILTGDLTQSTV